MQFLRTLIWVLLAVLIVAFSFNNWVTVPIQLWSGLVADINLPLLLAIVFLIGFLPPFLLHVATRWRLKQKLASAERTIADLRAADAASNPAVIPATLPLEPEPESEPVLDLDTKAPPPSPPPPPPPAVP